jgi:ribosome maturation factor RimP
MFGSGVEDGTVQHDRARDELEQIVESTLERIGFELVDLESAGHRSRPILRLRIDRLDAQPGTGVTVDECAQASRQLEEELDAREDLLQSYILEVSSPGVERPLRKRRDFRRGVASSDARRSGARRSAIGRGEGEPRVQVGRVELMV